MLSAGSVFNAYVILLRFRKWVALQTTEKHFVKIRKMNTDSEELINRAQRIEQAPVPNHSYVQHVKIGKADELTYE